MIRVLCLATSLAVFAFPVVTSAGGFQQIGWPDLTFPVEPEDDPFFGLEFEQRRDLETILDVVRRHEDGLDVTGDDLSRRDRAGESLRRLGLDPDALTAKHRDLLDKIALQRSAVRTEWIGVDVRIPGYVIPLEYSGIDVTEFLLVPYYGACIHTPPPPANQIIHVSFERGIALHGLFTPVWVDGRLGVDETTRAAQLSDGMAGFEVGYSLDARSVQTYEH